MNFDSIQAVRDYEINLFFFLSFSFFSLSFFSLFFFFLVNGSTIGWFNSIVRASNYPKLIPLDVSCKEIRFEFDLFFLSFFLFF